MQRLAAGLALILTGCMAASRSSPGALEDVTVVRVVDGDTVRVVRGGREERVRLIGIDTPEVSHDGQPAECFGLEAERHTQQRLGGRRVTLELGEDPVDPYGRTLAYVFLGEVLFNVELVERGFAEERAYPPNLAHQDELRQAEDEARGAGRGLWAACS